MTLAPSNIALLCFPLLGAAALTVVFCLMAWVFSKMPTAVAHKPLLSGLTPPWLIVVTGFIAGLLYYGLMLLRLRNRTECGPVAVLDSRAMEIHLSRTGFRIPYREVKAIQVTSLVLHDATTNKTVTNRPVHVFQRWTQGVIVCHAKDGHNPRHVICTVRYGGRRFRRIAKRIAHEIRVPITRVTDRHRSADLSRYHSPLPPLMPGP